MAEELLVVLNRRDPSCGLGFSLLGTPGLPPIIYDIVENSPAAESGKVKAGDVILQVNETDVNQFNTKEVLKCLRLSENPVALKLKRDPMIKEKVRHYLKNSSPNPYGGELEQNNGESYPPPTRHPPSLEDITRTNGDTCKETSPQPQPRSEAFVMTGDRLLKKSGTQQSSILSKNQRKVDSLRHCYNHNNHQRHNSVPTSPIESERHHHQKTNSAGTSPTCIAVSTAPVPSSSYVVRTSRSEDHLQFHKDSSMSAVSIDIDEDVTASLNTLLDTRPDSETEDQRIVWTYNAPLTDNSSSNSGTTTTTTSSDNISPHRSLSPASPTSVSSSVMSSDSDRKPTSTIQPLVTTTDLSQSEAISNISSPDFQDEDVEILNARDLVMEVSDPSDSDSTLLLSETTAKVRRTNGTHNGHPMSIPNKSDSNSTGDHRIVIQVKGPEKELGNRSQSPRANHRHVSQQPSLLNSISASSTRDSDTPEHVGYQALKDLDDESLIQLTEGAANLAKAVSPPPLPSEDESDVESLHSFHYSPKAVDIPSAVRLAKRLFTLDGFKKSDVSRHLSKNNDFSRAVAEEYLKYFIFESDSLDIALRKFLKQFSLAGETQERERVLVHFSKRFLDCNPGSFNSQDAVHTLTCAIMLLNTDLHGQIIGRKMTCTEFIDNLSELNDGENFPREVLKALYQAIKSYPLEWAIDDEGDETGSIKAGNTTQEMPTSLSSMGSGSVVNSGKGFFDVPTSAPAIEYKKGYVMRKCCIEPNGKKTPLGKRGWKMFYCTLRDLVLYLHKDEHGFRKSQLSDNLHNAIRIHHSLATKATDYTKKQHVFRLVTADQAEYLFQTSDSKELQSWIDTINFVCASFSAQPLPSAVGSQKKFQRPLLPSSHTKLNLREQLRDHEEMVQRLEQDLETRHVPERGAKALSIQNYKEKDAYLHYELKRYKTYAYLLRSRISQYPELEGSLVESSIGEAMECDEDETPSPTNNRKKNQMKKI